METSLNKPETEETTCLSILMDVQLPVSIRFGETEMALEEIVKLGVGSVIELSSGIDQPVELVVNNRILARGEVVTVDDQWGYGNSLEWATSCPPPRHNFTELPRIRSERPAFELHYPHMVERMRDEAHIGPGHGGGKTTEVLEQARRSPIATSDHEGSGDRDK